MVGIHLLIEKIDAGNLHGFDNGFDLARIAAFGEIGNAFNQSVGHRKKDNERGSIRQLALRAKPE
jgi:hypothetical protein